MKTTAIRNLTLGVLCASLVGAASFASAGDHFYHGYGRRTVVERGFAHPRFGIGLGVVVGAPVYSAPYYAAPYYGPVIEPSIVIGGGFYRGGYYHSGRYFAGHRR